ncbi:MAG: hypothetical protein JNL74_16150 [Fibrobacteres bacterium]|nr:hypothetical protein [Fibrobacterota bacterium]
MKQKIIKIHFKCNSNVNLNTYASFTGLPDEVAKINTVLSFKLMSEEIVPLLAKGMELSFDLDGASCQATLESICSGEGTTIETFLHFRR